MSRASEAAFDALHGLLAEALTAPLKEYLEARAAHLADPSKPAPPAPSPQLLSQAIKFLKDNGIDTPAKHGGRLGNLAETLGQLDLDEEAAARPN